MMDNVIMPNFEAFGGNMGMINISATLAMVAGSFTIDSLPQFAFEMEQAAESFNHNVWPQLDFLPTFKMQPLLNFSMVARLVIDLEALGIDPFDIQAFPNGAPFHPGFHDFPFNLTRPKLVMAQFFAGLPNLLTLSETLDLPPIGDSGAMDALHNKLQGLAQLTPPKLIVPLPTIPKMAMVLEALATIKLAFGDDSFSPANLGRIDSMLRLWNSFPIPIPWPALALKAKLDFLPEIEDVRMGIKIASSSDFNRLMPLLAMSRPKLAFAPMITAVMALSASLEMMVELPAFDMCGACNCC
jgi:hypothetical protein